jgi:hypothetical protein
MRAGIQRCRYRALYLDSDQQQLEGAPMKAAQKAEPVKATQPGQQPARDDPWNDLKLAVFKSRGLAAVLAQVTEEAHETDISFENLSLAAELLKDELLRAEDLLEKVEIDWYEET